MDYSLDYIIGNCPMKKQTEIIEEWEKVFDGTFYSIGRCKELECFHIYDSMGNVTKNGLKDVKLFIRRLLHQNTRETVKKIKKEVVKYAIEGKDVKDELKGLTLYSKTMTYLDKLLEEENE